MSQFAPNEVKVAIAPITAKPSGMSCEAELFLGPDDLTKVVTSGRMPFISTGISQKVRLPITMPQEGTYHGYIDVFTEDVRFLAYKTKEDVVIPAANYFEYARCSGWYHTIKDGWDIDMVTFNWKVISELPVSTMRGSFIVYGQPLLTLAFYAGQQGSFSHDCVMGAHVVGITKSGIYPYTVKMTANHWTGSKLIELCKITSEGEIQYTR